VKPLVIRQIDNFGMAGELVERYLVASVAIRPFGMIEIFITSGGDTRGGTGQTFW
jgi:hypothetical protein